MQETILFKMYSVETEKHLALRDPCDPACPESSQAHNSPFGLNKGTATQGRWLGTTLHTGAVDFP